MTGARPKWIIALSVLTGVCGLILIAAGYKLDDRIMAAAGIVTAGCGIGIWQLSGVLQSAAAMIRNLRASAAEGTSSAIISGILTVIGIAIGLVLMWGLTQLAQFVKHKYLHL